MANKGWAKLRYRAGMLCAYICPLCGKPTPEGTEERPSPKTRPRPGQPYFIKPGDDNFKYEWQCSNPECGSWHDQNAGRGFNNEEEDELIR